MNSFTSIKDLLFTLYFNEKLLSEMFKKRKETGYTEEYALELLDDNEAKLKKLLDFSILRSNGNHLEIDDLYLQFFEQILNTNEDINTSYINENLDKISKNIIYYLNENKDLKKNGYLRTIKNTLRKIGDITIRSVVDLKRNIENTFKSEPNYKNKLAKLTDFDSKRQDITELIKQTQNLMSEDELTFFKTATDEELINIILHLKRQLNKSIHNLIEIEKQIIDYLNQIKYRSSIIEKLRKVKYLKDQHTLETSTNFKAVLEDSNALIFEPRPSNKLKLSLEFLQSNDEILELIQKVAKKLKIKNKIKNNIADKISDEYLQTDLEEDYQVDMNLLKMEFLSSPEDLFSFIMKYEFPTEKSLEDKATLYCQMASEFDVLFNITEDFEHTKAMDYAIIYPNSEN
ncbi:hypothetical protein [Elizabethkingia sp. JS20170427COW]|uniref:hypothetical protein n=1 Tax=Elizabethkingia sp. JS20170427COW TaxID=2583851 RepID=UPI001110B00C|nr:hypothetical protein [Elizabethkingia sp. JS20170427COW]QCX52391.1 hypothetical protein FGE20_00815 [Elizabethkingia sp. JS20170427COW]